MEALTEPKIPSATQSELETDSELISPDLMTIILTTSPIPSAPSPELIQNTLASLPKALKNLPIVVTFDGFSVVDDEKERLKRGKIPQAIADTYPEYISNVKNLFPNITPETEEEPYFKSHGTNVTFLRLKIRQGFAYSVKMGLDNVKTPYVMVLQHDWLFTLPHPPMAKLLSILQNEPEDVKNIGFVARMSVEYVKQKWWSLNNRHVFIQAWELRKGRLLSDKLAACLHWFDRPHLCSVETYKEIFELRVLHRGDFIEDTFGTKYGKAISSAESEEIAFTEWKKHAAWLYYPNEGKEVGVRHGEGRKNLFGVDQEEKIKRMIRECKVNSERWKYKEMEEKEGIVQQEVQDDIIGLHHDAYDDNLESQI